MYIQNTFARRGRHDEMIAQLDALNMHRRGDSWNGHSATSKTTTMANLLGADTFIFTNSQKHMKQQSKLALLG